MRGPLEPLVKTWTTLLEKSKKHKQEQFGKVASECQRFFDGAHDFMYEEKNAQNSIGLEVAKDADVPQPTFKMTLNKVAELVQLFGPSMYFRNPNREVNDLKPPTPEYAYLSMQQRVSRANMGSGMDMQQQAQMMMQQMQQQRNMNDQRREATADVLQWYLNYLTRETRLKEDSRKAIDEALIKGRSLLWHELYNPPGTSTIMPRSVFDSVDNLLIDPDAKSFESATWIARECCAPHNEVEEEYGLASGYLKSAANTESSSRQASTESNKYGTHYRKRGDTHDLVRYYKIYTKNGIGQHMTSAVDGGVQGLYNEDMQEFLDQFGEHCYLVVADGIESPLNLVSAMEEDTESPEGIEAIKQRVRWPIPFHADNEWPCTELDFHVVANKAWPMPHMQPGLGELKFLNWAMSFLAGRVSQTSRTIVGVLSHLADDIQQQLREGGDLTVLKIQSNLNDKLTDMIQFMNMPAVNKDIWEIVQYVMQLFERRVGLTDLVYGQSGKQMRSASEAQLKEERISVRPDDMAERVESWQSRVARKEAMMTRWYVSPESVAPVFGEMHNPMMQQFGLLSSMWGEQVYVPLDHNNPETINRVVREFDYTIEAGSIRKPNRERDQANMDQAMQVILPVAQNYYAQTGDPTPMNALLTDWAKVRDLDPQPYMVPDMRQQNAQQQQQMQQQQQQQMEQQAAVQQQFQDRELQVKEQNVMLDHAISKEQNQLKAAELQLRTQGVGA